MHFKPNEIKYKGEIKVKELCKTFFKIKNKIINGYKVVEENGVYNIYVYTTCKKLGNWQKFLSYNSLDEIVNFFKKLVDRDKLEGTNESLWVRTENEWRKNTLDLILKLQ